MFNTALIFLLYSSTSFIFTSVNKINCNADTISNFCQTMALEEGITNPSSELHVVTDLYDNCFYVQTGKENGFMIYDTISSNFIEKSATFESPYDFSKDSEYYYFGPMNYYERIGDVFYSLINTDEYFSISYAYKMQDIFEQQLKTFRDVQSKSAYQNYCKQVQKEDILSTLVSNSNEQMTKKYINNYEYIRDSIHPFNYDNSCGFVAGSLILNYWDKTMHRGTVLDQYYDLNMNLNSTRTYNPKTNLKDKLVELNGGIYDSWGLTVRDSLIEYCKFANISASSSYFIGKIGLDYELANNRPVIVFGALPNVSDENDNLITHAVTCYGVESNWWGGYYIVNYGWGSEYNEVSIGYGFIGSITTFELTSSAYETSYTITPESYGYSSEYCKSRTTETISIEGNSIITNRLRCGYIENEYINLSPRKSGYDTAYIEYTFNNPVKKVDINLSFWSADERYNSPNVSTITFDYKPLASSEWVEKYNLLENGNMPTDRNNQKLFSFEFLEGTKNIRIYSHFDYMSGFTDRNKGRISIGNMTVYTYK